MRRLILASLDWTRPKDPPLSLGHASILANLLKRGVDVKERSWAVNHHSFDIEEVAQYITENQHPDVDIAFGAFVWNEPMVQKILQFLSKYKYPGRVILGGPQVSYVTKKGELERFYPTTDVFIRGYAEDALADMILTSDLKPPGIKGVHFAREVDQCISSNPSFEDLPSPYLQGIIPAQRFLRWETQRGCPFKCAFCQHRAPDSIHRRRKQFSLSRIEAETQWIKANPIIQDLAVLDPTFNSGPNFMRTIELLEGFTGKLSLQVRIEMIKPEFMDAVEKINQTGHVVLELGLQTINKIEYQLIDRPNNLNKVGVILDELQRRGITCELSLIYGLPGQTFASFEASVNYCVSKNVSSIHAFPLMLLRGTPLHDKKAFYGLVESSDVEASEYIPRQFEGIPHVVASPTFDYAEYRRMTQLAEKLETDYNQSKK